MSETLIVAFKIFSMFLVMAVGFFARRRGLITGQVASILSRFTTDIAFPSLIFIQMLDTVDRDTLRIGWTVPVLASAVVLFGHLVGWVTWRLFATREQAPTYIFVIGITNWIFLPLPIVQALYGNPGVQLLLISNAGVQVLLWTFSMAILQRGGFDRSTLLNLVKNPGFVATITGLILALNPNTFLTTRLVLHPSAGQMFAASFFEAMRMIGSLTIPLSMVVIGAQIAAIPFSGPHPTRPLAAIVVLRLLFVPLVTLLGFSFLQRTSWALPPIPLMIVLLISMMPVAVSCSIFTERFKQNTNLAAQSILYSTILSIATVPLLFALAKLLTP